MAFYAAIVRNVVLPCVYFLRREPVFRFYEELKALENRSEEEYAAYRHTKIEALLEHIGANIAYYRPQAGGCLPSDGELDELPLLTRETIRTQLERLVAKRTIHSWRSTSGTSGLPLSFVKDRFASAYMDAMMHRAYEWHGIRIGDRQARIWGTPVRPVGRMLQKAKDLLLNRRRLTVFGINDAASASYYRRLQRFRPTYFYAYVNGLYQFALSLRRQQLDGRALGIRVAICTGEVLFDYQRETIGQVFGCRVVNEYGSTENGIIGFECECGRMHQMPTVHVETIGSDAAGEVVVTELNSRSVPFVRYRLGDRARIPNGNCSCGRPYRLLEVASGRVDSYILCRNGDRVYDAILAYTLKDFVVRFRAVQLEDGRLEIDLVPRTDMPGDALDTVRRLLEGHLGSDMDIRLNEVSHLPDDPSGKLCYFRTKLSG